jgi:hypothetical protein
MATLDSLLSDVPDAAKRQKVSETVEDLLARLSVQSVNAALAANDEKWESRLSELTAAVDSKCETRINDSEARTKAIIDNLAQKVEQLKTSIANPPGTDPWSAYRPRGQHEMAQHSTFVPSQVDIKGWVKDWAKRSEQGLTNPEAMLYLHKLVTALPAQLQSHIDIEATKQANSGRVMLAKIEVKVKGGRDACKEVKRAFENLFVDVGNHVKDTKPRCSVESSPAMKPVIAQGAKMLGALERDNGIQYLKPEWGLKLSIYQEKPGEAPLFLADFSVATGWAFNNENLAKAKPGLTGEMLKSAVGA